MLITPVVVHEVAISRMQEILRNLEEQRLIHEAKQAAIRAGMTSDEASKAVRSGPETKGSASSLN